MALLSQLLAAAGSSWQLLAAAGLSSSAGSLQRAAVSCRWLLLADPSWKIQADIICCIKNLWYVTHSLCFLQLYEEKLKVTLISAPFFQ